MNIVISGENRWDNYGNFYFKDKADNEHKIGEKRKNQTELVDLVKNNPDKAISLAFAKYQDKDYIVGIELVSEQLEPKVASAETPKATEPPPIPQSATKNRAFALSYAKDLVVAGKIGVEDISRRAEEFAKWLDGII